MIPRSASDSVTLSSLPSVHERATSPYTSWTTVASSSVSQGSTYSGFSGYDIERFHARRRNGDLLPYTPFSKIELVNSRSTQSATYGPETRPPYKYRTLENWYIDGQLAVPWYITETELVTLAAGIDPAPEVQKAAAAIYSQGFDALTFIAELHKTVALFRSLVSRWTALISQIKFGQSWLEYRYGWRILWYDIVDFTKTLDNLHESRKRFTHRTGRSDSYVVNRPRTYTASGVFTFDTMQTDEITVGVRGSVTADIQPPKFQFNPLTTGWELIRFSFIIDWFISVGTFLEALSFLAIQTQYAAAGGVKITLERTSSLGTWTWLGASSGTKPQTPPYIVTGSYYVRIPQALSNRPLVNTKKLSVPKILDLWALLGGSIKGSVSGALRT